MQSESPTRDVLTEHSEKKSNKHCIISKQCVWLNASRKTWNVMHKKYFEGHAIKSHPVYVNLHVVTLDEEGLMGRTFKSPNIEGMP